MTDLDRAPTFEARIEPSPLDRAFVVVDPRFAEKLTTQHVRSFEVEAKATPAGVESLTRDVPNVGEIALEVLDERGLIRIGSAVEPGTMLVGKVTPRGGGELSPEEKLLRAIFGEAAGDVADTSLRAPPGCFAVVREIEMDAQQTRARVVVEWTRPLDIGDVLELDGHPAVVAEIRPLGAELAWSGGAFSVSVRKTAMARDLLHARSIGPYDPATQQPTIGRERFGGQVLEPEQIEILAAHAPWMLWEAFTIKSDSVGGRTRAYESIIKGESPAKDAARPSAGGGPSAPSTAAPVRDIFSFFEAPSAPPPPEAISQIAAHLRALGFEVRFDADEIGARFIAADEVRSHSHGAIPSVRQAERAASGASGDGRAGFAGPGPVRGDEGGLYSQKIFGPINDYRCECGKYARMKHRGVVCETCGVEVIQSRVRRERFGHIDLAQPCVHPQLRDQAATLLGLSRAGLDEMLAGEGGRAVRERLAALDLDAIDATETGPRADLALTLIEAELPATALMLEVVAVLPPDLRPIPSELGDQYARLMEAATTSAAQSAVDALFDSLAESVQRAWREQVFTKALDYSGAAHLTVDPSLAPRECRVPRPMITELFKPFVYHLMEQRGFVTTIKSAKRMVEQGTPEAMRLVEEASAGYPLLLAAGPNLVSRTAKPWDAPAIAVDPDTARRLSSRTVAVHLPLTDEGALECAKLDDLPYRGLRHPRGWLSRAMLGRDLLAGVRTAALKQERELLDDVVLERAFGRPPPPPNAAELARWRDERRTCASAFVEAHPAPTPEPPAQNPSLDRLVDELELSVASANALARAEIRTIRDLCRRTEAELLKTAGFGRKSLREIKEILADMGLSLGMVL